MIELQNNQLCVSFPEVHPKARCKISFMRTLRVPDDNRNYELPAGLGDLPLLPVDDFEVPRSWRSHGGVFLPMYQSEALWINFESEYPFAIKIAAGKINAVTGASWSNVLSAPQDYVVIPEQPWLDGFNVGQGIVRQFVAMPLGSGVTAEEQLTGEGAWGGLQVIAYPMKADIYRQHFEASTPTTYDLGDECVYFSGTLMDRNMGLAPGGRIRQQIAEDPYELDAWETAAAARCFVHLLNSEVYQSVTGRPAPTKPVTAQDYAHAGIPWFTYYGDGPALVEKTVLSKLDGLAAALFKNGETLYDNEPVRIANTINLSPSRRALREGDF